ncbi:MAG: PSD1 domain-containing protein [Candidatus Hydrogenedentes bacterium]|nr:PSD1 domain-containing protein [Candidatus Hydrogenedentota bacterium]
MYRSSFPTDGLLSILLCLCVPCLASPRFVEDVQPILQRSCLGCHGPEKHKSDYRLDVREIALKGGVSGKPAISPHDAANSRLIRLVAGEDEELRMPPENSGIPPLAADEIAVLRAWIDAGPAWPDELAGSVETGTPHWSLQPLVKPPVPGTAPNPIDSFVQAKLAKKELELSPPADRRTLLRRVYYDLIGLPPTPEAVKAFLVDAAPEAYERAVDTLLASPRYGERWARHWLDVVHFADSHGYEHDIARDHAWRFRDYVINALNKDTPWALFIREQLAADVFFPDEPQLTPALGFLGAGTFDLSTYSTAPVTFDYLDRDDLVTQTMAAFVSTTANCARCHAHKFDPISQEDYYALQANFAGVLKGDVAFDEDPGVARERRRWNALLAATERRDPQVLGTPENEALAREWLAQRGGGVDWKPLQLDTFLSAEGAVLSAGAEGIIVAGGPRPEKDTYTVTASTSLPTLTALRLDVHSLDSLPMKGPGRADNGNFHLSECELRLFEPGASQPREVRFRRATADFNQTDWSTDKAIDGDLKTAWGVDPDEGKPHHAVFELAEPLTLTSGARLAIMLKQAHGRSHVLGAFSLAATEGPPARAAALPAAVTSALALAEQARDATQRLEIAAHALHGVAEEALEKLPAPLYVFAAAKSVEMITGDPPRKHAALAEPKPVHLLERGEFDKARELVAPGALSALDHLPARFALKDPADEAERRAALADWIAHPDNVLTWRSIVNRVWHYHFGRGLCDTPSDFGEMGGVPSHPELIDWLAVWFRDDAQGSLKQLHRLIVTSATYRQCSARRAGPAALDEDNRLLWRQSIQRLDADAYRDYALAISGRLDLTMGGPGVQHFTQAKGPQLTPVLDYTAYRWNSPDAGRRSIYRFVWRGIADPFMEALDFPDLGLLAPARGFSASPLQALVLYNNDFVLEQSLALAHRVESEGASLEEQVKRAVWLAWQREPGEEDLEAFTEFAGVSGLPALCRVLLNSNEFLFVE